MKYSTMLMVASGLASPSMAASPAAKAFGARQGVQQISLSPDGTHAAIIVPMQSRGTALLVADFTTGDAPKSILVTNGRPEHLTFCHWSTNTQIVCQIASMIDAVGGNVDAVGSYQSNITFTRLVTLPSTGGAVKMLSARGTDKSLGIAQGGGAVIDWLAGDGEGSVLMARSFVPEETIGSISTVSKQGLGVERVDTVTLARRIVEQPRLSASEYITDGQGTVRIMGSSPKTTLDYDSSRVLYSYRKPGSRDWISMGRIDVTGPGHSGFDPYAVDSKLNVAYGFAPKDGRNALYRVALDDGLKSELVLANPDVDVDGLIRIGRERRVVGATYVTDKRQAEFFDPDLRKLGASLHKALPKQPLVTFVDADSGESKLMLFAGSDNDPGRYYLFDKATRKLASIVPVRPQLEGMTLASVKPITFPAADGTKIPAYLTLPPGSDGRNLPTIVMPHGGPGDRDEWGFDWLSQFYAARGYAVLQPNFRGSTGYGQAWFQKNGFQSWRTAIGDVNDAGRWLLAQGIAKPGQLAIVGWSYGGYAALQSSVLDPDLFKAIVAVAPVTDLETLRGERLHYADYTNTSRFIGQGAHIHEGSPAQNATRIKAPVLMFHGTLDRNVGIGESRLMASKLRAAGGKVELVEFKGLDHQLDDDDARTELLDRSDLFLRANLGL